MGKNKARTPKAAAMDPSPPAAAAANENAEDPVWMFHRFPLSGLKEMRMDAGKDAGATVDLVHEPAAGPSPTHHFPNPALIHSLPCCR
jgi:hypothetical protein